MAKGASILIAIFLCLLTGFAASQIQLDSLTQWYPGLQKSPLTPPNIAFPIAWTLLYCAMGLSIGLIAASGHPKAKFLILLFALQLVFNFLWSIAFFYRQSPLLGIIDIIILLVLIVWFAISAYPVNKISSLLFFPYIAWVAFASYLNLYILQHNPL